MRCLCRTVASRTSEPACLPRMPTSCLNSAILHCDLPGRVDGPPSPREHHAGGPHCLPCTRQLGTLRFSRRWRERDSSPPRAIFSPTRRPRKRTKMLILSLLIWMSPWTHILIWMSQWTQRVLPRRAPAMLWLQESNLQESAGAGDGAKPTTKSQRASNKTMAATPSSIALQHHRTVSLSLRSDDPPQVAIQSGWGISISTQLLGPLNKVPRHLRTNQRL
jgi:hypothetical protein